MSQMLLQLLGSLTTCTELSGDRVEKEEVVWAVSTLPTKLTLSQAPVAFLIPAAEVLEPALKPVLC